MSYSFQVRDKTNINFEIKIRQEFLYQNIKNMLQALTYSGKIIWMYFFSGISGALGHFQQKCSIYRVFF
jgi:hypothetical protein